MFDNALLSAWIKGGNGVGDVSSAKSLYKVRV